MKVHLALSVALYALALALRWVPLLLSTLPFNVDGFPLAWVSQQIGATGSWQIRAGDANRYSELMPVYPLVWSAVAQVGGFAPLADLQFVMPILTASVVLPAYLLGVKATRNPLVGFSAGLFAAIFGSFLFVTSAAMKEAVGMVFLPVVVLLFAERADPRKRALACLLLLILPFLHQLTDFLALGMIAALVVLRHGRAMARGTLSVRALLLDIATGPAWAAVAYAYFVVVAMPDLDVVLAPDALALFLATVVLLTALFVRVGRPAPRKVGASLVQPAGPILLLPVLAFAAILVNGRMDLFAGVLQTQPALLSLFPAVAVLVAFAFLGYQLVRRTTNRGGDALFAMAISPVALVVFAFLRGLDPLSQILIYRSFDFLDYALAAFVGIGFVYIWVRLRSSSAAKLALGAVLVVALVATTPMAWNSEAVFGVNNVTTPSEFQALSVLASLHPANVTTDQRLAYVAALWFGINANATLPFLLQANQSVSGYAYAVVLDTWSTVGAQVHPAPNVVLPFHVLAAFLAQHRIVYVEGPPGDRVYIVQLS